VRCRNVGIPELFTGSIYLDGRWIVFVESIFED